MTPSNRIIINTIAQYVRTILNMLLSLYSVRLIMGVLGVSDYGIYSLVAGVISLLSFFTNSLVISTQRFLSFAQGKGEKTYLKKVFSNSLLVHIILGAIVVFIFIVITPFLFNGFLSIPLTRISAAKIVYFQVVTMVYISFIASPYRALLVSHENIVYTSIIDVFDGVLKVVFASMLAYVNFDKLITYGWMMFFITSFNFFAFSIFCHTKYDECIFPRLHLFDKGYLKQLLSYTGWQVYAFGATALRTQGLAIVLNRRLGTFVNAAYGIGNQISGLISFVAASLQNAIAPQLTSAEGAGNRDRMWMLANMENKFAFLLLAAIGIPTIFEMPVLLNIWLPDVPQYSWLFGATFLSMQIVDMLTIGYNAANKAIGNNIGRYTLITYTPKLLILPIAWIMLHKGYTLRSVSVLMILCEFVCMILRVPLCMKESRFCLQTFVIDVFLRSLPPVIVSIIACAILYFSMDSSWRFLLTYILSLVLFFFTAYRFSLNQMEKFKIKSIMCGVVKKFRKT